MASQRSLTKGYVYPDAPRNYATDTNFIVGLTTNALVVGNVLQSISTRDTLQLGVAIILQPQTLVITRFNYNLGGVPHSLDLNISGVDTDTPRVVEELITAFLSKVKQNALPRILQYPEDCLSVTDAGGGQINLLLEWKEEDGANPFFEPISIEITGSAPLVFS